jgi:hypothetical protein
MNKGDPAILSGGIRSAFRDLFFEVMCGATCATFAGPVRHQEPDLTCVFQGVTYHIACKCIYGSASRAAVALRKGWSQVKRLGRGYVLANVVEQFPHRELMGSTRSEDGFSSTEELSATARMLFKETCIPYDRALLKHLELNPQKDRRKLRGIIYITYTLGNVKGTLCAVGLCYLQPLAEDVIRNRDDAFSREFHKYWEQVI